MIEERWPIPERWKWVNLGEISVIIGGGTPPAGDESNFDSEGIPWITPADLTGYEDSYIYFGRRSLSVKGYNLSSARLLPKGTVLFSSRAPIGYCVIAGNDICTSQDFKSFIMKGDISAEYLRYYLIFSVPYIESKSSGTTFKELSGAKAAKIPVPLPPLGEQKRIAAKIDGVLLKSKNAYNNLIKIQTLVDRFKSTILELAYNGELTKIWRKKNGRSTAPIMELRTVALSFTYGTSSKSSLTGKVPVLRMGNIQEGVLNWDKLVYTSDEKEIDKYKLTIGDVLFNRTNSPELVGKTAVFNGEEPAIFAGYLIRVKCSEFVHPKYLSFCLNSPQGREYCRSVKSDGVSQSNINAKKLASFNFPVPSIEEQTEIVNQIENSFRRIDSLIIEISKSIQFLNALEKSIMTKAFVGDLNLANESDEKVEDLLERIKNEKFTKLILDSDQFTNKFESMVTKKKILEVLENSEEWVDSQEVFRLCGINIDSKTEEIEPLYAELRFLDQAGKLLVEVVRDKEGKKISDRIKLVKETSHAT
jgi:type I restriction enzyme S subunit